MTKTFNCIECGRSETYELKPVQTSYRKYCRPCASARAKKMVRDYQVKYSVRNSMNKKPCGLCGLPLLKVKAKYHTECYWKLKQLRNVTKKEFEAQQLSSWDEEGQGILI